MLIPMEGSCDNVYAAFEQYSEGSRDAKHDSVPNVHSNCIWYGTIHMISVTRYPVPGARNLVSTINFPMSDTGTGTRDDVDNDAGNDDDDTRTGTRTGTGIGTGTGMMRMLASTSIA